MENRTVGKAVGDSLNEFNDWILEQYDLYHDADNVDGKKAMGLVATRFNKCVNDISMGLDRIIEDITNDSDN